MSSPAVSPSLARFADTLCAVISAGFDAEQFEPLALELFGLQRDANPAYRALCGAGWQRESPRDWRSIPAAPAVAFKELELTCLGPEARTAVFHSSGTTGQKPSRHWHHARSLAVYEASLRAGFKLAFLGTSPARERWRMVSLTPSPDAAPHSSLAHMMGCVVREWGDSGSGFAGRVDAAGAWEVDLDDAGRRMASDGRPVLVMGTAFGWVHLCDGLRVAGRFLRLPPGSRVMETGGYKGRSRELSTAELHAGIAELLGLPPGAIVREYGMSELSSQAYDAHAEGRVEPGLFHFPPWARACVVNPETGRVCGPGETGLLRIWDLANVYSAAVLQTEDRAVAEGGGFRLLGRAVTAEPRGCSLMAV